VEGEDEKWREKMRSGGRRREVEGEDEKWREKIVDIRDSMSYKFVLRQIRITTPLKVQ